MSDTLCLRCKTVGLRVIEPTNLPVTFFECPTCGRQYSLYAGRPLTFRWLHPITQVLYGIQFETQPTQWASAQAQTFLKQRTADEMRMILREIELELQDPTQEVGGTVNCLASENEVREYLRLFAKDVAEALNVKERFVPQSYPPGNRVGFRITLDENGSVHVKGGAPQLELLFAGLFGLSGDDLANRVDSVWFLADTVTDAIFALLKRFPNLRELKLYDLRNLTLTGWETLSELPKVASLDLAGPHFTDAYLERLGSWKELVKLKIHESPITAEAVLRFQHSCPHVSVDYEPQVLD